MYKKSFVSIYFLQNRLLVLQLSSNKKRLVRKVNVELPPRVIENFRVADEDALSAILRDVWKKEKIKEKFVGLILPEFSTFTKLFMLPKLMPSELAEAVSWQIQEFLPKSVSEMVVDWRIVEKKDDGYQILAVAVSRSDFKGYVNVCEKAGLMPLVVETPSIGLVRLTKEDAEGKLIIYKNSEETLLVVAQGEKIIGTSVVSEDKLEKIVKTATQMIAHYKDIKVKSIYLGGDGVTEALIDKLEKILTLKVNVLNLKIGGLNPQITQEYLIPISMQFGKAEEPSDPTTLNLLPFSLAEKYKRARLRNQIWSLTLTVTLFTTITFLSSLASYLFMIQNINHLKALNQENAQNSEATKNAIEDIKTINSISNKVLSIKKLSVLPQKILNEIEDAKPSGLTINTYKLDLDKGVITLEGIAIDRNVLLTFKQSLETNSDFAEVTIPISSFEEEVNLEFSLSFKYKPLVPSPTPIKKRVPTSKNEDI